MNRLFVALNSRNSYKNRKIIGIAEEKVLSIHEFNGKGEIKSFSYEEIFVPVEVSQETVFIEAYIIGGEYR